MASLSLTNFVTSSSSIARHSYKSESYSIDFSQSAKPLFASAYGDCVRIWSLHDIVFMNKSIEQSAFEIQGGVEMASVDIKFDKSGTRLAITSIDSSIKIYDISLDSSMKISANLHSDSNNLDKSQMQGD
jgi:WD40 repeat protein